MQSEISTTNPTDAILESAAASAQNVNPSAKSDDIMSVLLAHEKRANNNAANAVKSLPGEDSDSSSDEMAEVKNDNVIGTLEIFNIIIISETHC